MCDVPLATDHAARKKQHAERAMTCGIRAGVNATLVVNQTACADFPTGVHADVVAWPTATPAMLKMFPQTHIAHKAPEDRAREDRSPKMPNFVLLGDLDL